MKALYSMLCFAKMAGCEVKRGGYTYYYDNSKNVIATPKNSPTDLDVEVALELFGHSNFKYCDGDRWRGIDNVLLMVSKTLIHAKAEDLAREIEIMENGQ